MNRIILFVLTGACCLYAELPQKTHIWHLDDKSVTFSVSVFNNTQSAVYVPERWGSSTCKWITDKGNGLSHADHLAPTDKDFFLLLAQQTHTYTFAIRLPYDRIHKHMEGAALMRLEYSSEISDMIDIELTKPIALHSISAVIDLAPNQSSEPTRETPADEDKL